MASSKLLLLVFTFIAHQVLTLNAKRKLVPAVYVFGDSTADAGNNNNLNTRAKADKWPSGIDLNNVTGRFTNGKTGADFLAIYLGLPMAPPYLNLSDSKRSKIKTGINYASGACGILNTTRSGECLSLEQQVKYFTSTATKDLPKAIKNKTKLKDHLAKSIYLLHIGHNDYNTKLNGNITAKFTPQGFADYLVDEITKHIKTLYDLGGRKFLVSDLTICEPHQYKNCNTRYYADKLPQRLQTLKSKLPDSLFTIYDWVNILKKVTQNPKKYGFKNVSQPCYVAGKPICPNRAEYSMYDLFRHPTEALYEIISKDCFNGTSCSPYTLLEFAKAVPFCSTF